MAKNFKKTYADLSILISTYNSEKTIIEALDSINAEVLNCDVEIVIVDDGSSDATVSKILNYESKFPIVFKKFPENLGRPYATNLAVILSHGRYLAILDSDDISVNGRLLKSYSFLEKEGAIDVVAGQYLKFGTWGMSKNPTYFGSDKYEIRKFFKNGQNPIPHSSVMFRRSWFEEFNGYDIRLPHCQDFDLFLRGFKGNNYYIFPDVFLHYRTKSRFHKFNYFAESEKYRRAIHSNFLHGRAIEDEINRYGGLVFKVLAFLKWLLLRILKR